MLTFLRKQKGWLIPSLLILFICEAICLPYAISLTYADRSDVPTHSLTYTSNHLNWDQDTSIDQNGIANLNLFDAQYQNVQSDHHVIAPGTNGFHYIRLTNKSTSEIKYTAILYRINLIDLPVQVTLKDSIYEDTDSYSLPNDIRKDDVLRVVSGNLLSNQKQDFDIEWKWNYSVSESQDKIDTYLGNHEEDMTLGFYIIVEDNGDTYRPGPPNTSDLSFLSGYYVLIIVSLIVLVLLLIDRKREKSQ